MHQRITPFLWFDTQAEEAALFYTSIFNNSRITRTLHYGEDAPMPAGSVLTIDLEIDGMQVVALNGGPAYGFTPALSLVVNCDSQAEVDYYWGRLLEGGTPSRCGWLTDKFGVSWQIVPRAMLDMFASDDRAAAQRATSAMMQMVKLDLSVLQRAFDGN